jgi:hypothetical protein
MIIFPHMKKINFYYKYEKKSEKKEIIPSLSHDSAKEGLLRFFFFDIELYDEGIVIFDLSNEDKLYKIFGKELYLNIEDFDDNPKKKKKLNSKEDENNEFDDFDKFLDNLNTFDFSNDDLFKNIMNNKDDNDLNFNSKNLLKIIKYY